MKKIIGVILTALLLCAALATPALATAQYANTQDFLSVMDEYEVTYQVVGIDDDGDEKVVINGLFDECQESIRFFFTEDNETVTMYVWNVIEYDPANLVDVLMAVNDFNYTYRYVSFYADTTDNTVTAQMTQIVRPGAAVGDIVLEATMHMMSILDKVYPTLAAFAK